MIRLPENLRLLRRNQSGLAALEFALSLPFLLAVGLGGAETANMAMAHMKVAQLAVHLADNASRIGDTSTLLNRKIYESDINDLILGSSIHAKGLDFYEHGRAIISSLEVDTVSSTQFIHWQRCKGKKAVVSAYGNQGASMPSGMGPAGEQVTVGPGEAVIFVEVTYQYQPLISAALFGPTTIKAVESFMVRTSRDLSGAGIFQRAPMSPDPVADCSVYSGVPNVNI